MHPTLGRQRSERLKPRDYVLDDGRKLTVGVELDSWSVLVDDQTDSAVIGWPLEGVLAEALGVDVVHDDIPTTILDLAARILNDVPREEWPPRERG
jgi:hypothetical protein